MKCIKTTDAVGHVLCHDITRIVKDVVKDTAFRKGHIVQEEDIPVLLSLGKDHLYVWEKDENTLHENEAAQILCDVCINENMHPTDVKEGKIELIADCDGVFQVDVPRLDAINEIDEIMIATRHTNFPVKKGDKIAGTRIIPLVIEKEKMDRAEKFVHGRGAWMAFFAFIPILGSAISIVLGMMRANIWIVILAMTIGKVLRYALLVWGVLEASALMK